MQGYVAERTTAWAEFYKEWLRVTGGEEPAWPSPASPLCAETLRADGRGPPLRWSAAKAASALKVFPSYHAANGVGLADVLASLEAGGASWEARREVDGAAEELTRLFAEGATYDEVASLAASMGVDPCRIRIELR